ncbi:MAG: helix-turn-helix transcriptional regulator [Ruminococcaceae bacterium]|nr:helix-turn-helix transcriptional regulator [Oscillospiraceae bacterium]
MIDYNFNTSGLFAFNYYIDHNTEKNVISSLFTFIYVKNGFCQLTYDDTVITANEGQILFTPSDTKGELLFYSKTKEQCKGIFFHVRFFAGVNNWDYHPQVINPTENVIHYLEEVPKNINYKMPKKDCTFIKKAYTFLEAVQTVMVKSNHRYSELIENAIEYMFNNSKYSISDVARHCNISVRYLSKLFEKNIGISPVKMKQKIGAEKAEELLTETNLTIDEIASRVGFESTAHFRKVFQSRFFVSPREFRKQNKLELR